jgi:hypothetical protein
MGARFRLKATYDISQFSAHAQVVLLAMQHYGLILADNGSNWYFSGTEDAGWPDSLLSELKTVPAAQFDAIDESGVMLDANSGAARSCSNPSGSTSQLRPWWRVAPIRCGCPCRVRVGSGWQLLPNGAAPPRRPTLWFTH